MNDGYDDLRERWPDWDRETAHMSIAEREYTATVMRDTLHYRLVELKHAVDEFGIALAQTLGLVRLVERLSRIGRRL